MKIVCGKITGKRENPKKTPKIATFSSASDSEILPMCCPKDLSINEESLGFEKDPEYDGHLKNGTRNTCTHTTTNSFFLSDTYTQASNTFQNKESQFKQMEILLI